MIITYALRCLGVAAVIPPDRYTTITTRRAALFYSLPRCGADHTSLFAGTGGTKRGSPRRTSVSSSPRACRHSGRLLTPSTPHSLGSGVGRPAPPQAPLHLPRCTALVWTRPRAEATRVLEGVRAGTGPLIVVVKCLRACGQPVCPAPGGGAAVGRGAVLARPSACRGLSEGVEGRKVSTLITK